jgi:hypothetical protein
MTNKIILSLLICVVLCKTAYAQDDLEYFITANANLYVPFNSEKGMFPILGYDSESTPKVLIGGFGVGFSAWKKWKTKTSLKAQANISRSVYWESFVFRNEVAQITGEGHASSADYTFGITGTVHYQVTPAFSIGTGVGLQTMIVSHMFYRGEWYVESRYIGRNQYYKTFMPTLPVEMSWKLKKLFVNVRYEHGLLNRLKKDLAEYKTDKYGLIFFELGFKVK